MTPFYTNAAILLRRRHLTRLTIAQEVGWSERHMRRVLNGHTVLTVDDAVRVAQALKVPAGDLLFMEPGTFRARYASPIKEVSRVSA